MRTKRAADWTPSATLPSTPVSFTGVTYAEMLDRARALVPAIAARAEACEKLRRLPDDTERDLHRTGLFRMVQPARVGGADLDVGILVDTCAEIARVCPSTAWNLGNLGSHHWMLGYFHPEAQDELWDASPDVLIATSLHLPGRPRPQGRGRLRGHRAAGPSPPASTIPTGTCWASWCASATTARRSTSASP